MRGIYYIQLVIEVFSLLLAVNGQANPGGASDMGDAESKIPPGHHGMKFKTPELNEEEQQSSFMPDSLKCDACKAVTYQIFEQFKKYNKKHKYLNGDLPESDILDLFEDICTNSKLYEGYGVKTIQGTLRLTGQGLKASDQPGIMQGGGKWPSRLQDMCEQFMGLVGEEEIYNKYKEDPKDLKKFTNFLCYADGIRGDCRRPNVKDEF